MIIELNLVIPYPCRTVAAAGSIVAPRIVLKLDGKFVGSLTSNHFVKFLEGVFQIKRMIGELVPSMSKKMERAQQIVMPLAVRM